MGKTGITLEGSGVGLLLLDSALWWLPVYINREPSDGYPVTGLIAPLDACISEIGRELLQQVSDLMEHRGSSFYIPRHMLLVLHTFYRELRACKGTVSC